MKHTCAALYILTPIAFISPMRPYNIKVYFMTKTSCRPVLRKTCIFLLIFSSKSLLVYNFLYTFAPANQETNHLHG